MKNRNTGWVEDFALLRLEGNDRCSRCNEKKATLIVGGPRSVELFCSEECLEEACMDSIGFVPVRLRCGELELFENVSNELMDCCDGCGGLGFVKAVEPLQALGEEP
jgi:hypothetical protein